MKICVYAISKNEEQFVKRFYESAKAADLIVLADTGSTDNTVGLARGCGMSVYDITVNPWRFDLARNTALALIPPDIDVCVALDLDEVLMPGWREEIERVWTESTSRLQYRYDWGRNHTFNATKVHSRKGYSWQHICHEMIFPDSRTQETWATTEFLLIKHLPDDSKSRSSYLPLLEAAVKENPHSARDSFYLAREWYFNGEYKRAIEEFQRYLALPDAQWYHERCYALRIIGKSWDLLGEGDLAMRAFRMAVNEAEMVREPWVDLAESCQKNKKWDESFFAATRALSITKRDYAYTSDESVWGSRPYDAAAIAAYYLGYIEQAKELGMEAWTRDMTNPRLKSNLEWYSK